jgi:hypothetical protein
VPGKGGSERGNLGGLLAPKVENTQPIRGGPGWLTASIVTNSQRRRQTRNILKLRAVEAWPCRPGEMAGVGGQASAQQVGGAPTDAPQGRTQHRRRRLSDHILIAFHFACDQGDFEVADRVLGILQRIVLRPAPAGRPQRRSDTQPLVAALERLWILRDPEAGDQSTGARALR